jgi:hypothetical protein
MVFVHAVSGGTVWRAEHRIGTVSSSWKISTVIAVSICLQEHRQIPICQRTSFSAPPEVRCSASWNAGSRTVPPSSSALFPDNIWADGQYRVGRRRSLIPLHLPKPVRTPNNGYNNWVERWHSYRVIPACGWIFTESEKSCRRSLC